MKKAVVILGAGASAPFGLPTLRTVFKDAQARRYLKENIWLSNRLNEEFWGPRGFSLEDSEESLTIEEMLTLIRDWNKENGREEDEASRRFRKSLYILIQKALFIGKHTNGKYLNGLISLMKEKFEETTWASFNWDCMFEASYWYSSNSHPYARSNPRVVIKLENWRCGSVKNTLLKLHGGINWWMVNKQLRYLNFSSELIAKWYEYENTEDDSDYPIILEPSYYKYSDANYELLAPQWLEFDKRLKEADFILIIGYSLPDADANARSALTRAFMANKSAKWAVVDPSPSICAKYRRLFGRIRLKVFEKDLVAFNTELEANIDSALE